MVIIKDPGCRALQIMQLAKRIILNAQSAGDLEDYETAAQLLHMAEALMLDLNLTQRNRISVAKLLIGAHQRFWHLRDQRDGALISRYKARIWPH